MGAERVPQEKRCGLFVDPILRYEKLAERQIEQVTEIHPLSFCHPRLINGEVEEQLDSEAEIDVWGKRAQRLLAGCHEAIHDSVNLICENSEQPTSEAELMIWSKAVHHFIGQRSNVGERCARLTLIGTYCL